MDDVARRLTTRRRPVFERCRPMLLGTAAALALTGCGTSTPSAVTPDSTSMMVETARAAMPSSAKDVDGAPGGEVVRVKASGEVWFYDYATDTVHEITVNGDAVTAHRTTARLQPPPSKEETRVAVDLLIDDARATRPPFATAFEKLQGVPLVAANQVTSVGGSWVNDGSNAGGKACGRHRCLQLIVSTAAGTYLDTADFIVDLSARRVLRIGRS